ncbi:MAG: helix-turn-helix domain-containing protein [Planctomycetota bacterium]
MKIRTRRFEITDPDQLEAIRLPVRAEIVDVVSGLGPVSCCEIAGVLGMRRPAVHYQVNRLLDVGLLLPAGERGDGRNRVALVKTPAREMSLRYAPGDRRKAEQITSYVKLALQRARRLLDRAFTSGRAVTRGSKRNTHVAQSTCRLTASQLARVNQLIDELVAEVAPRGADDEGAHHLLTIALAPIAEDQPEPKP